MRGMEAIMDSKGGKQYIMYNDKTEAKITTNEKYLPQWIARGFKVVGIIGECSKDSWEKLINEGKDKKK